MGVLSNLRGSRAPPQEGLPSSDGLSSSTPSASSSSSAPFKMKWSNFLPIFVALVVLAEIAFLGRLDVAKNAAILDTMADYLFPYNDLVAGSDDSGLEFTGTDKNQRAAGSDNCEEFLEREDAVGYSRDFNKVPIFVSGGEKVCFCFSLFILFFEGTRLNVLGCGFSFSFCILGKFCAVLLSE